MGKNPPLTLAEGLALLDTLETQLSPTERELRREAFRQARRWMITVHHSQGIHQLRRSSFPQPKRAKQEFGLT